jgi:hypothetical protein
MPKSTITAKGIAGLVLLVNAIILIGETFYDRGINPCP